MDYAALRARLAELALAATDMRDRATRERAFAQLAAETVTREGPVEVLAVVRHLIAAGKMAPIQRAAAQGVPAAESAVTLLRTLRDYGETHVDLRAGTPERRILDALVPTYLSGAERDAVVALGRVTGPRWPGLREGHLQNAAALPAAGG